MHLKTTTLISLFATLALAACGHDHPPGGMGPHGGLDPGTMTPEDLECIRSSGCDEATPADGKADGVANGDVAPDEGTPSAGGPPLAEVPRGQDGGA